MQRRERFDAGSFKNTARCLAEAQLPIRQETIFDVYQVFEGDLFEAGIELGVYIQYY